MNENCQTELFGTKPVSNSLPLGTGAQPLFEIEIPGRLPSWNEILGMEQWARYKFKQELADVFLSALRATEKDSSMRTTSPASTTLTYSATLESYLQMRQALRRSKLAKKKLALKNQKEPSSLFTRSKVPF